MSLDGDRCGLIETETGGHGWRRERRGTRVDMLMEKATGGRTGARPAWMRALFFERVGESSRRQDPLEMVSLARRTSVLLVVVVILAFLDRRRRIGRRAILGLFDRFEGAYKPRRGETPSCSGRLCASRGRARRRRRGRSRLGGRRRRARERVVVRFVRLDVPLGRRGKMLGCIGSRGAAGNDRTQERTDRTAAPARRRRRWARGAV